MRLSAPVFSIPLYSFSTPRAVEFATDFISRRLERWRAKFESAIALTVDGRFTGKKTTGNAPEIGGVACFITEKTTCRAAKDGSFFLICKLGLVEFEYDCVVAFFVAPLVARPAYADRAQELGQLYGERLASDLIRDEMRPCEEV